MPEGTAASQWAHAPPTTKDSPSKEPTGNARGGRGNPRGRRKSSRRQSSVNTGTAGGAQSAPAPEPASTQPSSDAPRPKLIDRLSMAPETPATSSAPNAPAAKADSPDSKSDRRRGAGRRGAPKRKQPPAKVNTTAAQKEVEKQKDEEPEPEQASDSQPAKDAPPHIDDANTANAPPTPSVNGLVDKLKVLNPSAPATPRPYTPSAIDWAGDTEDGSLPDLDDWGVSAKSGPATKGEDGDKLVKEQQPAESKPNGRTNKRKDSKGGRTLAVPSRNGANASGNSSSRPATPSSAGFGSPSLRGKPMPARTSSRASNLNDPPQITVTSNSNAEHQDNSSTTGLGLDLSVDEPVFASLNDPPLDPPSEDIHIRPVRAPNTHPNGRGGRGRGRGRMSDGNSQPRAGPGFGAPMHMPMAPPSPHMPPSPHLPPSPYMHPAAFPPNGFHPGYNAPPQGYPQPHSPGFGNQGFGHQHPYSHPQHAPRHHSPRPNQNPHSHEPSPRHQRTHSRPIINGAALSLINKQLQGATSPPKSKADVSASS